VLCTEEVPFDQQAAIDSALKQYPDFAALASPHILDTCKAYGVKPAGPIENHPVSSDKPTLVFSGEFDPITPPSWAEEAAKTLSNSFYFNVPRAGHGSSATVDCPRSIMLAFLDNPTQKPDSACLAEQAKGKFAVPLKAADFKLIPFTETQMNLTGVVPDSWKKLSAGAYSPSGKMTDSTALVHMAAPLPANSLISLLESQFASTDHKVKFEKTGTRSANGTSWDLYSAQISIAQIDLAVGTKDGTTYLVMMQSLLNDHPVLYDAVFLPAVDALKSTK